MKNVSSILKETKLHNHINVNSFLKQSKKQSANTQRYLPYLPRPPMLTTLSSLNSFNEYTTLVSLGRANQGTANAFRKGFWLTEVNRGYCATRSFYKSPSATVNKLNSSMHRFQNDIFNNERYEKMNYDESEIYNKRDEIRKLIDEKVKEIAIKGVSNKTDTLVKNIQSNHLKFNIMFKSICISFKDANTFNTIYDFYLPFELVPIFYYKNFEFFKLLLCKIVKFNQNYDNIDLNERAIYHFLQKNLEIRPKLSIRTQRSNQLPKSPRRSRQSCITDSQIKLIKISECNIKPISISDGKENDANITQCNIFSFSWSTPNKLYEIVVETPMITIVETNSLFTIDKYIDYDLLFYLYQRKFLNWDFFILNYMFSFKQCRLLIDKLLSKINSTKTAKKILIGEVKKYNYQMENKVISYISTNEIKENTIHLINPCKLKVSLIKVSNTGDSYKYTYNILFNFAQMKKIYEGLSILSIEKISKMLLKFTEIKNNTVSFDYDAFNAMSIGEWTSFLNGIKHFSFKGKRDSVITLNSINKESEYLSMVSGDCESEKIIADFEEPELISNTIDEQGNLIKDSLEKISFLFKTLFTEKINRWPKFTNSIIRAKIKNSQFKILRSETITENSRMTSPILSPKRMSHRKSLLI